MKKENWLDRVLGIDLLVSGLCLAALIIVTFLGVIMRYFLNNPFVWEEEVQLALITWVIYFGGSAAFRNGSHIAIDMIVDMLPKTLQKAMSVLIYLATVFVLVFIMRNSMALISQFIRTNRTTDVLHIPSQFIYMALPIGCALMIISYTIYCVREIKGGTEKMEGEDAADGN